MVGIFGNLFSSAKPNVLKETVEVDEVEKFLGKPQWIVKVPSDVPFYKQNFVQGTGATGLDDPLYTHQDLTTW